jgi:hypothetical protein
MIEINIPLSDAWTGLKNMNYSCEFYDNGSNSWITTGCLPKATINADATMATCYCNHLTEFASGEYVEPVTTAPVIVIIDTETPVDATVDDSSYDYVFWGCMNAFYCALILWFWYIVLAIVCRKLDKSADDQRPSTEQLHALLTSSPRSTAGVEQFNQGSEEGVWELRRKYLGVGLSEGAQVDNAEIVYPTEA